MLDNIKLTDVVAALGVLTAFVTALVGLLSYRSSKQVIEAKDAQIAGLKEQIVALKDLSPEAVKKQSQAVIDTLQARVSSLQDELAAVRKKLREKSEQLQEAASKNAETFGMYRAAFNISNNELELRRLSSFIMLSPWNPRPFPDNNLYPYEFYLNALDFFRRDEGFTKQAVMEASEWILDYLLYPLLACMLRAPGLAGRAEEIYSEFVSELQVQDILSDELPLYRDLLRMVRQGVDWDAMNKYSIYQHLMISEYGVSGYPYAMPNTA